MEALREILQWWQSLLPAAKVTCAVAMLVVIAALSVAMHQGYSAAATHRSSSLSGDDVVAAQPSPKSIFSLPLPGTRQRNEDDIAQRLEAALSRYDYIASAQALFAIPLTKAASPESPRLALQLQLDPTSPPPQDWVENLVTVVRHTVPEVEPTNLLVTDTSGTVLFSQGRPTPPAPTPAATNPVPAHLNPSATALSTPWLAASGLGAICVILAGAAYGALRRRAQHPASRHAQATEAGSTPGERSPPLQFLTDLTAGKLTGVLLGERPEVAALALGNVPDEATAVLVRQTLHLDAHAPADATRAPRPETLLALAEALRAKSTAGQDSPAARPTAPVLHSDSEGD